LHIITYIIIVFLFIIKQPVSIYPPNNLATHCLLCGYQAKNELIDEEVVRLAVQEMGL